MSTGARAGLEVEALPYEDDHLRRVPFGRPDEAANLEARAVDQQRGRQTDDAQITRRPAA